MRLRLAVPAAAHSHTIQPAVEYIKRVAQTSAFEVCGSSADPQRAAGPGKNSFGGYEVGYAEFDEGKGVDRKNGGSRYPARLQRRSH